MPSSAFIQKLNAATIAREGTSVLLAGGVSLKAIVHASDHELLRAITSDGDAPEKRPLVLVFAGTAWGTVKEDMTVTIGMGDMARNFRIAAPLHPAWRSADVEGQPDVVTELPVVAFPDQ